MRIQSTQNQPTFGVLKVSGLKPRNPDATKIAGIAFNPHKISTIIHKESGSLLIRASEKIELELLPRIQAELAKMNISGAKVDRLTEEQLQNSFANPQKGEKAIWRAIGNYYSPPSP